MQIPESTVGYYQVILRITKPKTTVNFIQEDPAENKVLDSALSINAEVITTGDRHLPALQNSET